MTTETTDQLWARYRAERSLDDRNALAERYLYLAERTARIRAKRLPRYECEDLLGAAAHGLLTAIDRYDPTRGVKFETFSWYYMHGAITDQLRKDDRLPDTMRRNIKAGLTKEVLHYPLPFELAYEGRPSGHTTEILDGMPPLESIVFYSRYWLGHTFREIAQFLATTERAARDLHDAAIHRIRKEKARCLC